MILQRGFGQLLQMRLARGKESQSSRASLLERMRQQGGFSRWAINADIECSAVTRRFFGRALPVRLALLCGEMLVNRRFQVVDAGDVYTSGQSIGCQHIVCFDLRAPPSIVELECAVKRATGPECVDFGAALVTIQEDGITQRLRRTIRRNIRAGTRKRQSEG